MTGARPMTGAGRLLVVGSYPPIPLPAADASVSQMQRGWDEGLEVTVVSPRLSAADLMVPVAGPLAGHRLKNLRRHTSSDRLALVLEPGFPLPASSRLGQWLTVQGLTTALKAFDHVTVVRVGPVGLPPRAWRALTDAADVVVDLAMDKPATAGVTPLGPSETGPLDRGRQMSAALGRRLLGRHYGALRIGLARVEQRLRAVRHG
jgi:hypothetical protein